MLVYLRANGHLVGIAAIAHLWTAGPQADVPIGFGVTARRSCIDSQRITQRLNSRKNTREYEILYNYDTYIYIINHNYIWYLSYM